MTNKIEGKEWKQKKTLNNKKRQKWAKMTVAFLYGNSIRRMSCHFAYLFHPYWEQDNLEKNTENNSFKHKDSFASESV